VPDTVRKYLSALSTAKIDLLEIGFRYLPGNKFQGAFAYSTDEYLSTLNLPVNIPVAVMINAAEVIKYQSGEMAAIDYLFDEKTKSPVDIVRIAVKANDITCCEGMSAQLSGLGYRVFVNLMQIDAVPLDKVETIAGIVEGWGNVETLYFADSFGNLELESVKNIVHSIQKVWTGSIGIHAHDNKGLALSNSLAAINYGVTYIDSTLSGMGRGAGNTKTEFLLVELLKRGRHCYFPDAIFPLVLQEFAKLQKEHQWGPSIYYYLSALHGIHPTYIQEMLGDERYGTDHILSAINFLKQTKAPFFSFENMIRAASGIQGDENGSWSAEGWLKGRTVLIIGAGLSTKQYSNAIELYIKKHKPFVMCLNVNKDVPGDWVDAYVACHETRILIESDKYEALGKSIIIPVSRIPDNIHEVLNGVDLLDYGLRVDDAPMTIDSNGAILPAPLALSYAIAVSTAAAAERLLMVGVDGYDEADKRQKEMIDILTRHQELSNTIPMIALTPTTYPIKQRSIFENELSFVDEGLL
jgi:4-hydroxy 2-oxovalerate aldolase